MFNVVFFYKIQNWSTLELWFSIALCIVKPNLRFLEVQHQLNMAEKELEKKFSQTGAYKNLKKMLASKNDTIKEMRRKLNAYEPETACDDEKEED